MDDSDERIKIVEKLLGESSDPLCKHCEWPVTLIGRHAPDCALRKIDPTTLQLMKYEASDEVIRLGKLKGRGSKVGWNGLPPFKKTLVKRRTSKNRGPARDLKYCRVCTVQTLFLNEGGQWVCKECNHERPCEYLPNARNCKRCHP